MFRRWFSFTVGVVVSVLSASSPALVGCQAEMEGDGRETVIYYANGIRTPEDEALRVSRRLKDAYKAHLESNDRDTDTTYNYKFAILFNYHQTAVTDTVQALNQKMREAGISDAGVSAYQMYVWIGQASLSLSEITRQISVMPFVPNPGRLTSLITAEVLQGLGETIHRTAVDAVQERVMVEVEYLAKLEADLRAGKRVIIVAHSQGNLFANEVVRRIKQRQPDAANSIAIIGVATPASREANEATFYVSARDDRVLDGLSGFEDVLPPNVDNDLTSFTAPFADGRDFLNHSFLGSYFAEGLSSRQSIDMYMDALARDLPYPSSVAGEGAIRASLTWGPQPDVDLHAFEPNGSHVYYAARTGRSGMLDLDDTTSEGPENYVVACDDVEVGVYTIGVNYFRGDGAATAVVALLLGDGTSWSPRTKVLATARGSSGDASPVTVFVIEVADSNGSATYSVR